jgi:hypothetical protein
MTNKYFLYGASQSIPQLTFNPYDLLAASQPQLALAPPTLTDSSQPLEYRVEILP